MEQCICGICDAEFNQGHLNKDTGICKDCERIYPGVKTKEDLHKEKKPEVENHEAYIKGLVTKQVNELLESFGILHRCLDCSGLFYKRSPAQKNCGCVKKETK